MICALHRAQSAASSTDAAAPHTLRQRYFYYKTADGCKGGWTRAQHAPRRGETTKGCRRINYRYYNPQDGRWTRRDPIGIEGGRNLYNYVGSNPIGHLDVRGLSFEEGVCQINMIDPGGEYKACRERCEKNLYYDNKAIEGFTNSATQSNSSIGAPRGASIQEIIAVLLYAYAFAKYKACLDGCAYKHYLRCKMVERPIYL